MRYLSIILIFCSLCLAESNIQEIKSSLKQDPKNKDLLIQLGIAYHDLGVEGNEDAVEQAQQYLNRALKLNKDNTVATAYLGSVLTMIGRDAFLPWNKIKYAEQGIDKIDKAVELDSKNLRIRMVRAMNSMHLPGFFHRQQYSLKDFTYIIQQKEFKEKWKNEDKALLYYNLGLALEKDEKSEQAKSYFELAIRTAPKSSPALQAQNALKIYQ